MSMAIKMGNFISFFFPDAFPTQFHFYDGRIIHSFVLGLARYIVTLYELFAKRKRKNEPDTVREEKEEDRKKRVHSFSKQTNVSIDEWHTFSLCYCLSHLFSCTESSFPLDLKSI